MPSDIGGRYSVLTAVGLLPLAVAGIDIDDLMAGALKARSESVDNLDHDLYKYAVIRDTLYRQNYKSELYVVYEPQYAMFNEWLKQLYGESEGKEKKGLFPTSVTFSTDLHSLGQFIQDGSPILFETTLFVENPNQDVVIPSEKENLDELNYLAGKTLPLSISKLLKAHSPPMLKMVRFLILSLKLLHLMPTLLVICSTSLCAHVP